MKLVLVAALGMVSWAAAEQKIARKSLPPAVEQAVKAEEAKGATVVGLAKETEDGKTVYEVETKVNGRTRDLLFSVDGQLIEAEEAVGMADVPDVVTRAFAAHGRVASVERVTKGTTVTYEARVVRNGKTSEVKVHPDGTPVK
jgi:uncharacterized membrane protein YkoI